MKRLLTTLLCVVLLASFASALAAQEEAAAEKEKDPYKLAVAINPFLLLIAGELHASVSVALNNMLAISVYYTGMSMKLFDSDDRIRSVSAGLRVYPWEKVHKHFYIGPFLNYTKVIDWNWNGALGFGMELGGMIPLGRRFFIDLGGGLIRYFGDGLQSSYAEPDVVMPVFNMLFGVKL